MPGITLAFAQWQSFAEGYLWAFIRISALLTAAPIFGPSLTPARVRLVLAGALAWILFPLLPAPPQLELLSPPWVLAVIRELSIGLILGFLLRLVFEGIMLAGELCSISAGLSFAQVADPLRGVSTPVVSQLFGLTTATLFLVGDGHLALIRLAADSFQTAPVGTALGFRLEAPLMIAFAGQVLGAAVAIALPVMVALLLVNLAIGIVSRATPALNLFALGFPVSLLAALLLIKFSLPVLAANLSSGTAAALEFGRHLTGG